jgi:hypothetical protein
MSLNLGQYLSDVFRNGNQKPDNSNQKSQPLNSHQNPIDHNICQFIVDQKFSLGLDEII